jgi:hypothetical protein
MRPNHNQFPCAVTLPGVSNFCNDTSVMPMPLLLFGVSVSRWGGWFIAAAFAGILVWEEVWDLPNTAYMSGWLLLLITGGRHAAGMQLASSPALKTQPWSAWHEQQSATCWAIC